MLMSNQAIGACFHERTVLRPTWRGSVSISESLSLSSSPSGLAETSNRLRLKENRL